MTSTLDLARQFMAAAEAGDIAAARTCFHPDAGTWHNYDRATQTLDQNMKLLAWMASKCTSRHYDITRLEEIDGGYLQQHTLRVVMNDGTEAETDAIAVVTVEDGKIRLIEEYIDPAPLAGLANQR